jgi:poly-beta-hydroxyalkanoate depolymerase
MAGPIDTRILPTKVNNSKEQADQMVRGQPHQLRADPVQGRVPSGLSGFVRLAAFVSMNGAAHQATWIRQPLPGQKKEKAAIIKTFYDEYFAVMDLPRNFTPHRDRTRRIQGISCQGKLMHRGRR